MVRAHAFLFAFTSLLLISIPVHASAESCKHIVSDNRLVTPFEEEKDFLGGQIRVVGEAYHLKTDALLYCEMHYQLDSGHRRVDYYQGEKLIARKLLGKTTLLSQPSTRQYDLRSGEERFAGANAQSNEMMITYRKKKDAKLKQKIVKLNDEIVVDAGFTEHIRTNWDVLLAGDTLAFDFASPVHKRLVGLRVVRKPLSYCDHNQSFDKKADHCFSVAINNSLLRVLVGDLKVVYGSNKLIKRFEGTVNLNDTKGKTMKAGIRYRYAE